jgi:hypothetical protein
MTRLKIPNEFIDLIINLEMNGIINIQTFHGMAEAFVQDQALPQGSPIAPLLYRIHADPLLCRLQAAGYGYEISPSIKVPGISFADDLNLIAETKRDTQALLDITNPFFAMHKQSTNAKKTEIHASYKNKDPEYPNDISITETECRTNIKQGGELVRYLGALLDLNSNHNNTFEHAYSRIKSMLEMTIRKYCPNHMSAYIVKAVIMSILSYRLQVTLLNQTQYEKIDRLIDQYLKRKYNITNMVHKKSTWNEHPLIRGNPYEQNNRKCTVTEQKRKVLWTDL